MSNKKQSSVEWLAETFTEDSHNQWEIKVLVKKALQMHKEEIVESHHEGYYSFSHSGEQYYNETFGGDNEQSNR